jgi:hypothetical protein
MADLAAPTKTRQSPFHMNPWRMTVSILSG